MIKGNNYKEWNSTTFDSTIRTSVHQINKIIVAADSSIFERTLV